MQSAPSRHAGAVGQGNLHTRAFVVIPTLTLIAGIVWADAADLSRSPIGAAATDAPSRARTVWSLASGVFGLASLGWAWRCSTTRRCSRARDGRGPRQAIGFSGPRVFRLVMTESVLLSLIGGIVGIAAAMLMLDLSRLSVGAEAVTIAFSPSLRLATTGLIVSLIVGFLAGIAPAIHAARTEIVPALRQG